VTVRDSLGASSTCSHLLSDHVQSCVLLDIFSPHNQRAWQRGRRPRHSQTALTARPRGCLQLGQPFTCRRHATSLASRGRNRGGRGAVGKRVAGTGATTAARAGAGAAAGSSGTTGATGSATAANAANAATGRVCRWLGCSALVSD